jgi:hypothetical protein
LFVIKSKKGCVAFALVSSFSIIIRNGWFVGDRGIKKAGDGANLCLVTGLLG